MDRRRRVPRVSTIGWLGTYFVEGDIQPGWGDCRLLDISVMGVGIELFGDVPQDLIGRRIVIQVHAPVGTSVSLRLVGEVRNTTEMPQRGSRVGMVFVDLSETELAVMEVIEQMGAVW